MTEVVESATAPTTIRDVARAAGVPTATVSRVINGTYPVSPETVSRVRAAISQLHFAPNVYASLLGKANGGIRRMPAPLPRRDGGDQPRLDGARGPGGSASAPATRRVFERGARIATLLLAACLTTRNGNAQAYAAVPSGHGDGASQTAATSENVRRLPADARAAAALGESYLRRGKWVDSVHWLAKAWNLTPGDAQLGYELAFARAQSGDLDGAASQIRTMLETADTGPLRNLLATVDERRGDYLEAARDYHRAAAIDPSESNVFDLATFLVQHSHFAGFVEESIKFFRYGVDKYPASQRMRVGLGVALYSAEQYNEAVEVFCAAVDMDPKDQRPLGFLGRVRKVSPALAGEVDSRLEHFAQLYPNSAAANYYYALSLWERGGGEEGRNLKKIEGLLLKAEAESPQWYEPHYQSGLLLQSEERYPEAIGELEKAVRLEPAFEPAHFHLAMLYGRTGNKPAAEREASIVQSIKNSNRKQDEGQGEHPGTPP